HAGVGALPRRLGDLAHQVPGAHGPSDVTCGDRPQLPVAIVEDRLHELVGDPHRVVGVLILDRVAVLAVEIHVEAGLAEVARLALFARRAPDELLDVGVIGVEDHHLGGAAGLASGLDRPGRRIGAPHEAGGTAGGATALEALARGAQPGQVDPR